ncbi:hypothetical protein D3C71_1180890 [compost metagenome]
MAAPIAEPQTCRRLALTDWKCLQGTAQGFGKVSGGKQRETDTCPKKLVENKLVRKYQRNDGKGHEDNGDRRNTANQIHIKPAWNRDKRHLRPTTQRQQYTQRERANKAGNADQQGDRQSTPTRTIH